MSDAQERFWQALGDVLLENSADGSLIGVNQSACESIILSMETLRDQHGRRLPSQPAMIEMLQRFSNAFTPAAIANSNAINCKHGVDLRGFYPCPECQREGGL